MRFRSGGVGAVLLLTFAAAAHAHGGAYRGPGGAVPGGGGGGGSGGGPPVPPGTADPPASVTEWETWWASNKEPYLRLAERMRETPEALTPGSGDARPTLSAEERRRAQDALVREGLAPVLAEALGDDSFEVRTAAAVALGKTGDPSASEPLRRASVEDRHQDVRDAAVLGLGLLGQEADVPFLDAVLHDRGANTRHRSFAAFALGMIGGPDAATSLLRIVDPAPGAPGPRTKEPPLLASTYVALGLSGEPSVLPVLRAALDDRRLDDQVRAFAVLSLGRAGDRESLDRLGSMLARDPDAGLRRSAAIAIGRLAGPRDVSAVDALLDAMKGGPDPVTRQFAAISLGRIADEVIVDRLLEALDRAGRVERPFMALALGLAGDARAAPRLRKALADEVEPSLAGSYCIALALLGDRASAPLLEEQLARKGRVWLQGYAAISLGLLESTASAPLLRERLEDENDPSLRANLAVGLGLLHDARARTWLVETARGDGSIYERGGAAMALGVLRMNRAVPDLVEIYRNRRDQDLVRAFAVVSLGLIADPSPVPKLAAFAIDNNYSISVDPLNEVLTIL